MKYINTALDQVLDDYFGIPRFKCIEEMVYFTLNHEPDGSVSPMPTLPARVNYKLSQLEAGRKNGLKGGRPRGIYTPPRMGWQPGRKA